MELLLAAAAAQGYLAAAALGSAAVEQSAVAVQLSCLAFAADAAAVEALLPSVAAAPPRFLQQLWRRDCSSK